MFTTLHASLTVQVVYSILWYPHYTLLFLLHVHTEGDTDSIESGYSEATLKLLCGCGNCSIKKLLTKGCDDPTHMKKFMLLDVTKLPNAEKQQYLASLHEDAEKLNEEFAKLCDDICESFRENQIEHQRVANFLKNLKFLSLSVQKKKLQKKLENAQDMLSVFSVLADVCSWFNHHPLGSLVKRFGSAKENDLYKTFVDECLMKYLKRSVTEIPIDAFDTENLVGSGKFRLKIDSPDVHENITGQQLLFLKKKIADVLKIENENLYIFSIEEGCFEVEFLLPDDIFSETFPLSPEQINNIAKIFVDGLKVKSIKYGDKYHEFNSVSI